MEAGILKGLWARGAPRQKLRPFASFRFGYYCAMLTGMVSPLSLTPGTAAQAPGPQLVYFGTYTGKKSKGIYVAEFDPATGKLSVPKLAAETRDPTFLAVDPTRGLLFAVNEVSDYGNDHSGAVSVFRIEQRTGDLKFLTQQASGGSGPCHLAVSADGKCVLVANYGSGSVAVLPVQSDGRLDEPSNSVQHHGSSVNSQRQEGPHSHFICWDPANRLVLACDLGLDKVMLYDLDKAERTLSAHKPPFFVVSPGSGPRHLVFAPDARHAYLLNEMSSTLTVCSYNSNRGELAEIQTISTLPEGFKGQNTCAEVQVHPSGKFVYASNRGHNSITVFAVDGTTENVKAIQREPTKGKTPRHFAIDPSAQWLLAENQDSDNVVVFAVDPQTGQLRSTGATQEVGAPVCAVFVPKR